MNTPATAPDVPAPDVPAPDVSLPDVPALEVTEVYRRAAAEFTRRAHLIGDRWQGPTPCTGWNVRQLLHHLVEEQRWAPPLLAGQTIASVGDRFADDLLGDDPIASLDDAATSAWAAVRAEGAMARTVHLSFGDVSGAEYAWQLAADHLVHAWDLARAIGADDTLDPAAVVAVRDWFSDREPSYRTAGVVGPRTAVPAGAGTQTQLLSMFGRDEAGAQWLGADIDALATVEQFNRAFATRDVDAIMAAMTPDCLFEDTTPPDGTRHTGTAAVRAAWEALFAAAPRGVFTSEETTAAGDRVISRWRYDFDAENPAAGHVRGIDLFTIRDGLIAAKRAYVKG